MDSRENHNEERDLAGMGRAETRYKRIWQQADDTLPEHCQWHDGIGAYLNGTQE
jgi:hypothetical protein